MGWWCGGGGVLTDWGHIGFCVIKGYGVWTNLVWNRLWSFTILVWNWASLVHWPGMVTGNRSSFGLKQGTDFWVIWKNAQFSSQCPRQYHATPLSLTFPWQKGGRNVVSVWSNKAEGASFVSYVFSKLKFFIIQVHESWLQRYIAGVLSQEEPEHVSPWSAYEHQLILQPSHPEPAAPWIRISIQIIKKPIRKAPLRKRLISFFNLLFSCGGGMTTKIGWFLDYESWFPGYLVYVYCELGQDTWY